ncbi:proline/glycine betaine ABC transporter ATP-binding protein [Spirochaetia bacterium]|nr:proline/glycine betaine ABC transporter ATP-binding protein [Spirochaetia bacterium]
MIEFRNVGKSYVEGKSVLENINLTVDKGELLVLLGNSGSGKTTLLKLINRLLDLSTGSILINETDINNTNPIELRRGIGYVIQRIGLFPHMTVKENIEIIGKIQKKSIDEIEANTARVMEMIGLNLEEYLYRYPDQLSGGQQQRIGVARALSTNPEILLMDEPFSALDPLSRVQLQNELLKIQSVLKKTIVFVTHDIDEAIKLADRICILNEGYIEQVDTPKSILKSPCSEYVNKFLGVNRFWKTPHLLTADDIMSKPVPAIPLNTEPAKALEMLKEDLVPILCVVDEQGKMIGKLTEKIMMRHLGDADSLEAQMKTGFDYLFPDTSLTKALEIMIDHTILYLPVLDDRKRPVGVINVKDLMRVLNNQFESGNDEVSCR